MTWKQTNQRPDRAIRRLFFAALAAATFLAAVLGAGGAEIDAKGSKGEEIPSRSPRIERAAAPGLTLPIR